MTHSDHTADEPLGPATPDEQTPAGDTPEVHEGLTPRDVPRDNPGRPQVEEDAAREGGTTSGNR